MRRRLLLVLAAVAALVGVRLVGSALSDPPAPGGPRSSARSTGADGVGAFADLLRREHRQVMLVHDPLERVALAPTDVLFVLDAPLRPEEGARVAAHVRGGGSLVLASQTPSRALAALGLPLPRRLVHAPGSSGPLAPAALTAGIREVATSSVGFAGDDGGLLPVLGGDGAATTLIGTSGDGRVVVLPDASPLWNANLARADNAAFALALVAPGQRAVFAEHAHGATTGAGSIPSDWQLAIAGLALATVLLGWARARRLGPPERPARALPPPRAAYVEALASTLAHTPEPGRALAPLRDEGRRLLALRASGADPDDAALRATGSGLGVPAPELDALLGAAGDRATMIAAGRAVARLAADDGGW